MRVRMRLKWPVMSVQSVLWSRWLSEGEKLCSQAISSSSIWETSTGRPLVSSLESASSRHASSKYSTHCPSNLWLTPRVQLHDTQSGRCALRSTSSRKGRMDDAVRLSR
uniref:Putative secreted protein n=1 Tax=Ixodes ricinus TaxID=34613 RepID=A0A6B0UA96_IXORI